MSPNQNIAFVLVPGSHCPGAVYSKVVERLVPLGYTTIALENPSSNGSEIPAGFYDDVAYADKTIASLADQGKDVILVGNSYGGFIITGAGRRLSKPERKANGKPGGLVAVVFISALLSPVGVTCHELINGGVDIQTQSEDDFIPPMDAKKAGVVLFGELNEEEQEYWAGIMRPQCSRAMSEKLTYLSYEQYPTTVMAPVNDVLVSPAWVKETVDTTIASGFKNVRLVSIEGDHLPMISRPDEVVQVLLDTAKSAQ